MRRPLKVHHAALPIALAAATLLALGGEDEPTDGGTTGGVTAQQVASVAPTGRAGNRGPRGPIGPRGPQGRDAGVERQFISINWQNNQYEGQDRQSFVAPGIGEGEVQCIPPQSPDGDKGDGKMRIQFFHSDGVKERPERWATTMWVTRFGGNVDDGYRADRSIVKTNRIKETDDNRNSFSESMDSAPIGQYDPENVGAFTGIITTEPFNTTKAKSPPPTTFKLSWYWNFRDTGSSRCYVTGTFVTAPG